MAELPTTIGGDLRQTIPGPLQGVPAVVLDPEPLVAEGLRSMLGEAGVLCDFPKRLPEWLSGSPPRLVVISLHDHVQLDRLRECVAWGPQATTIGIVRGGAIQYARAFGVGAHAVVDVSSPPEDLLWAIAAALEGRAILPGRVMLDLVAMLPDGAVAVDHVVESITGEELRWLRTLAQGSTVLQLAVEVGYSEREMYRRLRRLYDKLGVNDRTGALMLLSRWCLDNEGCQQ